MIDVANAFSTVPHKLLEGLIGQMGLPAPYVALIIRSLQSRLVPADGSPAFVPRAGVRQGCPLSVTLFVLFFDLVPQRLGGWLAAYMDDVGTVEANMASQVQRLREAEVLMARMGLHMNAPKTVLIAAQEEDVHVQWADRPPGDWQRVTDTGVETILVPECPGPSTFRTVKEGTHLGHPIRTPWDPAALTEVVAQEAHGMVEKHLN